MENLDLIIQQVQLKTITAPETWYFVKSTDFESIFHYRDGEGLSVLKRIEVFSEDIPGNLEYSVAKAITDSNGRPKFVNLLGDYIPLQRQYLKERIFRAMDCGSK